MERFSAHVLTAAVPVADGSETTEDLTAGTTLIPVAIADDFFEGTHAMIDGEVYAYDDELTDNGEESGVPSITLTSGLVADVAAETRVDSWNPNANDGAGEVICVWQVQVAPDGETDGHTATLAESLVPTTSGNMPPAIGDAVKVEVQPNSSWLVINKEGSTPGISPAFFVSGGIGTDTVVWAGEENGRRAQLNGIEGSLEAFNDANEQTVNLDGANNYVEGTFATGKTGARVEIGAGEAFDRPAEEARFYTSHADETEPGKVTGQAVGSSASVVVSAPQLDSGQNASLVLFTSTAASGSPSQANLGAGAISVTADGDLVLSAGADVLLTGSRVGIDAGLLDAEMGDGDVGSGTFRDSVDARTPAVLGGYGHTERSCAASQNITSGGSPQVITWGTSVVTERGGITYSSGTFTIGTAGTYIVSTYISLPNGAGARRQCAIRRNSTAVVSTNQTPPTTGVWSSVTTTVIDCAASDTIDVTAFQDSGGNLAVSGRVSIHRLA